MPSTDQMLYNQQKFLILSRFTDESATRSFTPAYAYAWAHDLFPVGSNGAEWHRPYEHCFAIREEKIDSLAQFLDSLNLENKTITFYELEDHYDVRGSGGEYSWDRMELIHCCRYFRLLEWFGDDFWKGLVGHSNCPSESHSIMNGYDANDVFFE